MDEDVFCVTGSALTSAYQVAYLCSMFRGDVSRICRVNELLEPSMTRELAEQVLLACRGGGTPDNLKHLAINKFEDIEKRVQALLPGRPRVSLGIRIIAGCIGGHAWKNIMFDISSEKDGGVSIDVLKWDEFSEVCDTLGMCEAPHILVMTTPNIMIARQPSGHTPRVKINAIRADRYIVDASGLQPLHPSDSPPPLEVNVYLPEGDKHELVLGLMLECRGDTVIAESPRKARYLIPRGCAAPIPG